MTLWSNYHEYGISKLMQRHQFRNEYFCVVHELPSNRVRIRNRRTNNTDICAKSSIGIDIFLTTMEVRTGVLTMEYVIKKESAKYNLFRPGIKENFILMPINLKLAQEWSFMCLRCRLVKLTDVISTMIHDKKHPAELHIKELVSFDISPKIRSVFPSKFLIPQSTCQTLSPHINDYQSRPLGTETLDKARCSLLHKRLTINLSHPTNNLHLPIFKTSNSMQKVLLLHVLIAKENYRQSPTSMCIPKLIDNPVQNPCGCMQMLETYNSSNIKKTNSFINNETNVNPGITITSIKRTSTIPTTSLKKHFMPKKQLSTVTISLNFLYFYLYCLLFYQKLSSSGTSVAAASIVKFVPSKLGSQLNTYNSQMLNRDEEYNISHNKFYKTHTLNNSISSAFNRLLSSTQSSRIRRQLVEPYIIEDFSATSSPGLELTSQNAHAENNILTQRQARSKREGEKEGPLVIPKVILLQKYFVGANRLKTPPGVESTSIQSIITSHNPSIQSASSNTPKPGQSLAKSMVRIQDHPYFSTQSPPGARALAVLSGDFVENDGNEYYYDEEDEEEPEEEDESYDELSANEIHQNQTVTNGHNQHGSRKETRHIKYGPAVGAAKIHYLNRPQNDYQAGESFISKSFIEGSSSHDGPQANIDKNSISYADLHAFLYSRAGDANVRRYHKFHCRNAFTLQIGPDGTVNGTMDQSSEYTLLRITSIGSQSAIQIYGIKAKRFICMDQFGKLHSMINGQVKPHCTFIKSRYGHHYFTLTSAIPHPLPPLNSTVGNYNNKNYMNPNNNNYNVYQNNTIIVIDNSDNSGTKREKLFNFYLALDKNGQAKPGYLGHKFSKSSQFFASYH